MAFGELGEAGVAVGAVWTSCSRTAAAVDDGVGAGLRLRARLSAAFEVEGGNADADFLAYELLHFGRVAGAGAGGGEEGAHADIDGEAAFDDAGDGAGDGAAGLEGFFERGL